jgi:syntaxin 8
MTHLLTGRIIMSIEQDDQLDALSEAISRQKDLSRNISSELELHSELIEETDAALDGTDARMRRARDRLDRVSRGAKDNGATCIIVLLIVVLLVLIIVFKT